MSFPVSSSLLETLRSEIIRNRRHVTYLLNHSTYSQFKPEDISVQAVLTYAVHLEIEHG